MIPVPSSVCAAPSRKVETYLKLISKLFLNPDRHLRFLPIHGQKQVILKIYGLRENRESLNGVLRKWRQRPSSWNKLEFCCVEGEARLRQILATKLEPPPVKTPGGDLKEYLSLEVWIVPLADFCELFKGSLGMFRVQLDHIRCVCNVCTEMHPEPSCGVGEEGVYDSVRSVRTHYSLLLWTCEVDPKQSQPLERCDTAGQTRSVSVTFLCYNREKEIRTMTYPVRKMFYQRSESVLDS